MNTTVLFVSVVLAVLLTAAQVAFKMFALQQSSGAADWRQWATLLVAISIYFMVFVMYVLALRRIDLSLLYPAYTAMSVLLTFAAGVVLFQEQVSARSVFGCALLLVSIYLISSPKPGGA